MPASCETDFPPTDNRRVEQPDNASRFSSKADKVRRSRPRAVLLWWTLAIVVCGPVFAQDEDAGDAEVGQGVVAVEDAPNFDDIEQIDAWIGVADGGEAAAVRASFIAALADDQPLDQRRRHA